MGRSESIKTQMADNTEFTKYLNQCTANLLESAKSDRQRFQENIKNHYKSGWSMVLIGSGLHTDYKQSSEFSLEGVTKTLESIAKGFFGSGTMPAGSTKTDQAASVLPAMLSEEALILQAALTVITNLLAIFSTKIELTYTSTEAHEMVKAGLTLHLFVMDASYQSSTYFGGNSIEEDIFEYQLIWSPEQQKQMGAKAEMDGYTENLRKAIATLATVQDNFDTESVKADPDLDKLKKFGDTIGVLEKQIAHFRSLLNGVTMNRLMLLNRRTA
jgi:hypothetical protein